MLKLFSSVLKLFGAGSHEESEQSPVYPAFRRQNRETQSAVIEALFPEYREKIERTLRPFTAITLKPAPFEKNAADPLQYTRSEAPAASQFGGLPFLPKGSSFPQRANGDYYYFLAQINLSELSDNGPLPSEGMLQFYIDDGAAEFDRKVLYLSPEQLAQEFETDFSYLPEYGAPVYGFSRTHYPDGREVDTYNQYTLSFEKDEEYCSESSREARSIFYDEDGDLPDLFFDSFFPNFLGRGHKIGGYANFVQGDVRQEGFDDFLLLQVDSCDEFTSWGDCGSGQFFISAEDLRNRCFERCTFFYSCS